MAATSPYTQNDYQAFQFRPAELPMNDIFKGIMVKNQYWNQKAAEIKNQYENALGLNLITDGNKARVKDYTSEARKKISQLSAMDLTDPSVKNQAANLFKPLFSDENIMGENYVATSLDKELSAGEYSRTENNGKYYNPESVAAIQLQKNIVKTLNTEDAWKVVAPRVEKYLASPELTAEMDKIMKIIKSEEEQTATVAGTDGWLIQNSKSENVRKDRIKRLVNEVGSPQLKEYYAQKHRLEFYNKFLYDRENIDSFYQSRALTYFENEKRDLEAARRDVEQMLFLTPEKGKDDDETKKLNERRKYLQGNIDERNTHINKFVEEYSSVINSLTGLGDVNNFQKSLNNIENIGLSSTMYNISSDLAYEKKQEELKPNLAKMYAENLVLNKAKYDLSVDEFEWQKKMDVANLQLEAAKADKEKAEKAGQAITAGGINVGALSEANNATDPFANVQPADRQKMTEQEVKNLLGSNINQRELIGDMIATFAPTAASGMVLRSNFIEAAKSSAGTPAMKDVVNDEATLNKIADLVYYSVWDSTIDDDRRVSLLKEHGINSQKKNNIVEGIKNMDHYTFTRLMTNLVGMDPAVLSKATKTIGNPAAGLTFYNSKNKEIAKNIFEYEQLKPRIKNSLGTELWNALGGDLSNIEDVKLRKVWENYKGSVPMIQDVQVIDDGRFKSRTVVERPATQSEIQNKTGVYYRKPSYNEFKNTIYDKLYPVIGQRMQTNQGKSYYGAIDLSKEDQRQGFNAHVLNKIQWANTDANDRETLRQFESYITGFTINTPSAQGQPPTINFQFDNKAINAAKKDMDPDIAASIDNLLKKSWKFASDDPRFATATPAGINYTKPGAIMYVGYDGSNSGIVFKNISLNANQVSYVPTVFGDVKYKNQKTGELEPLTQAKVAEYYNDIIAQYAKNGMSEKDAIANYGDEIQAYLSRLFFDIQKAAEK